RHLIYPLELAVRGVALGARDNRQAKENWRSRERGAAWRAGQPPLPPVTRRPGRPILAGMTDTLVPPPAILADIPREPTQDGPRVRLYLVDGSGYLFRAYHALPPLA